MKKNEKRPLRKKSMFLELAKATYIVLHCDLKKFTVYYKIKPGLGQLVLTCILFSCNKIKTHKTFKILLHFLCFISTWLSNKCKSNGVGTHQ